MRKDNSPKTLIYHPASTKITTAAIDVAESVFASCTTRPASEAKRSLHWPQHTRFALPKQAISQGIGNPSSGAFPRATVTRSQSPVTSTTNFVLPCCYARPTLNDSIYIGPLLLACSVPEQKRVGRRWPQLTSFLPTTTTSSSLTRLPPSVST